MSNVKSKASHRLLAALLSIVMVLSLLPTSMVAYAATEEYEDYYTVTVTDGENPVEGATVKIKGDTDLTLDMSADTDAKGVAAFDTATIEEALTDAAVETANVTIEVSKDKYETKTQSESISKADLASNADITLVSLLITDVKIEGKTLTYDGTEQKLVSVTEVEGDTVEYYVDGAVDAVTEVPTAIDANTYSIKVVVTRAGKEPLEETVTTVINPANIEGISIDSKTIAYNEKDQELVTLTGSFEDEDVVTWTVNTVDTQTKYIPTATAVGKYTITLTVDRGSNYNKLVVGPVTTNILEGELDLDGLTVKGLEGVYTVKDGNPVAQPAVSVDNQGDYDLKFQLGDKDKLTVDETAWSDEIPTVTDAGSYIVWVRAVKDSYNDKDVDVEPAASAVAPYNVYIAKAEQSFSFDEYVAGGNGTEQIAGEVPYAKEYNFGATDTAALAEGTITYDVELSEDGIASIDPTSGLLTVDYPGTIKVIATLSGNDNYNDCVINYTLEVSGVVSAQGQYIRFANDYVDYTLGTSDIVSTQTAPKTNSRITGAVTYGLDRTPGVAINRNNGTVTVQDYNELANAIRSTTDGTLKLVVTATKAGLWPYGEDTASYIINITFETTPTTPYTLPPIDGTNGWYKSNVDVTPAAGYNIAKNITDTFESVTTFDNQGTETRYVYLRNTATGGITDMIAVNVMIDTVKPDASKMKIEFSKLNLIQKIGAALGFYNPSVTITFTAEDVTSGIDHFDWTYTRKANVSLVNKDNTTQEIAVTVEGTTATATLTLPADEAEQLHGKISFNATDKAGNVSEEKTEDYIIIVDTISPTRVVTFTDPVQTVDDTHHYFNGDVVFTFTVNEANFDAEDENLVVKVSKNGAAAQVVNPTWVDNSVDEHVGTFTIKAPADDHSGDGDYVITMTYKDKANNTMEEYESDLITIDTIKPVVKIEYVHEGNVQKTIFTVEEHNFFAGHVVINPDPAKTTMKDINGNDIAFNAEQLTEILQTAEWTQSGENTYTFEYDGYINGIYNLTMEYTDYSKWEADSFKADEFIIDHDGPTDLMIEYYVPALERFVEVITLGFYNPSVTVRFTAYDTDAGVETFTWGYTKEPGASTINHPDKLDDATVSAVQDQTDKSKFTAEITLTANDAAQYRGHLSLVATDAYKNDSVKKVDNGNIIVVDTIAPTIKVEYTEADRAIGGTDYYYNNDIDVKFTVTEANFYAEDVNVAVTKNGSPFDYGTVTWGTRDSKDETIGTFTLKAPDDHSGDGHYVITVEYTDRSTNEMKKYVSDTYTIDTTLPVISVEYQNKDVVNTLLDRDENERSYFADTQTAVITITEHNFIADEVDFTIVAKDVIGAELDAAALNSKTQWTVDSTGDVHTITITYPGDANYTFDIAYTDMATNAAKDYAEDYFTVDKTAPTNLTVDYSTSVLDTILESLTFGFYNAKMTVTLTADDPTSEVHSFLYSYLNAPGVSSVNAELINEAIKAADITYSADRKTATVTFEIPKMVLGNDNQFNGTVEFTATDRAGNESDVHKETKRVVVDNIAPTAQVSYNEATNVVGDISYYNGNVEATITINEANFYANDVRVTVSKDNGAATAVTPTWTDNNVDVHIGKFTLTEDGDYIVTINYTDKSSNQMATYTSKQMTIDTQIEAPTYTINGVGKTEIGGAYKGDATVGFNFADQNFDTHTIKLTRTRFDSVDDVTSTFIKVTNNDKGGSGSFTIPSEVGNDGIYDLTITMKDKALHETESSIRFTINRFGSVYEYSDELVALIKDGGQYVQSVDKDLVITEYNADRLLQGSLNILITRDGENVDVDFTSNPANINAEVGIGESGWYQYMYTIKASNFEKDGVYKISLSSKYDADDVKENESTSVPDNSIDEAGNEILDSMNFTVDSVAPEIRNIINMDKEIADADKIVDGKLNVKYTVVDDYGLKSIEIKINGTTIQTLTEEDLADAAFNYSGSFDIDEQSGITAQKVQMIVTDRAGNVTDTNSDEFRNAHSEKNENSTFIFFNEITVSRNFWVRWYANKPLFWGSIGGVVVLAGAIWFLIVFMKKKKEEKDKQ